MFHVPSYFPAVSLRLSQVLDKVGLNETTVSWRQDTYLKLEKMLTTCSKFLEDERSVYNFGSQIEGSTTPGLLSDVDTVYCLHDKKVIQTLDEWSKGQTNLLIVQGQGLSEAYCNLRLLRDDSPMPVRELPNCSDYAYDTDGNVLLKNTIFHESMSSDSEIHGPAQTVSGKTGFIDCDYVFAYKCDSWPIQACPWIKRVKKKYWPSHEIVKFAEENGSLIVPVGHRLSKNPDIEWRISPSLAERRFMLSMNITQMKCYVLLKMIKKQLLTPRVGEYVTSFQLKSVLFICMENTKPGEWKEDNLLKCVSQCLIVLLYFVLNRFCPNYIFPGENLFAGRNNEKEKDLIQIVKDLIRSDGRFILSITYDDLGILLQNSIQNLSTPDNLLDAENSTKTIIGCCEHTLIVTFLSWFMQVLIKRSYETTCRFILDLIDMVQELRMYRNHPDDKVNAIYNDIFPFVCSFIGSAFTSYLVRWGAPMSPVALLWLNRGLTSDRISGRIKLASALHSTGYVEQAAHVLAEAEHLYDYNCTQHMCACRQEAGGGLKQEFHDKLPLCADSYERRQLMACCVLYTPQELHCCPPALRFEWSRDTAEELLTRDPNDKWMDFAVADSITCLYYLQFVVYNKLGNYALQQRALDNLDATIKQEGPLLGHLETALNLLGKCMEMEHRFVDASRCYCLSLQKRPVHNAAHFHMRNLPDIMNGRELYFEYQTNNETCNES